MGKTYLWRTANMSRRTCVVVKQMQSNPIQSKNSVASSTKQILWLPSLSVYVP